MDLSIPITGFLAFIGYSLKDNKTPRKQENIRTSVSEHNKPSGRSIYYSNYSRVVENDTREKFKKNFIKSLNTKKTGIVGPTGPINIDEEKRENFENISTDQLPMFRNSNKSSLEEESVFPVENFLPPGAHISEITGKVIRRPKEAYPSFGSNVIQNIDPERNTRLLENYGAISPYQPEKHVESLYDVGAKSNTFQNYNKSDIISKGRINLLLDVKNDEFLERTNVGPVNDNYYDRQSKTLEETFVNPRKVFKGRFQNIEGGNSNNVRTGLGKDTSVYKKTSEEAYKSIGSITKTSFKPVVKRNTFLTGLKEQKEENNFSRLGNASKIGGIVEKRPEILLPENLYSVKPRINHGGGVLTSIGDKQREKIHLLRTNKESNLYSHFGNIEKSSSNPYFNKDIVKGEFVNRPKIVEERERVFGNISFRPSDNEYHSDKHSSKPSIMGDNAKITDISKRMVLNADKSNRYSSIPKAKISTNNPSAPSRRIFGNSFSDRNTMAKLSKKQKPSIDTDRSLNISKRLDQDVDNKKIVEGNETYTEYYYNAF